ncbi:MAG: cyclic nucleotide-binding domain-containing protein [Elusimicrobia bacterium]|nr:cyclic nucleotide-binding domain-containing protein [Elusimicrobiota bacterium]
MDAMTFLRERVALFAGVTDENLAALAGSSVLLRFSAGQTILFKGATVDGLHVVVSGKAGVYVKPPNRTPTLVAELGAGEVFGEVSIVEMGTAGAAIKAAENDTLVLMIPQESFRHVLQQDESFAVRVNTLIAARKAAPVPVPT